MRWTELTETLVGLIESVQAPADSGLSVYEVTMDVPLEVTMRPGEDGLVFYGRVPHSRWRAGFLPPVHLSHLDVVALPNFATGDGGER